jgi:hypothetical protein
VQAALHKTTSPLDGQCTGIVLVGATAPAEAAAKALAKKSQPGK